MSWNPENLFIKNLPHPRSPDSKRRLCDLQKCRSECAWWRRIRFQTSARTNAEIRKNPTWESSTGRSFTSEFPVRNSADIHLARLFWYEQTRRYNVCGVCSLFQVICGVCVVMTLLWVWFRLVPSCFWVQRGFTAASWCVYIFYERRLTRQLTCTVLCKSPGFFFCFCFFGQTI